MAKIASPPRRVVTVMRIIAGIVMIGMGAFALYTVSFRPQHKWSGEPLDQAIGISKIVNRIIRGAVGLLFIIIGIVAILRAVGVLAQ